jgi:hypothetical protein
MQTAMISMAMSSSMIAKANSNALTLTGIVRIEKLDLEQSIGDGFRVPEQLSHSLARSREVSSDSPAGRALKKSVERTTDRPAGP